MVSPEPMSGDAFANFESVSRLPAASFLIVGAGQIARKEGKEKKKKKEESTGARARRGERVIYGWVKRSEEEEETQERKRKEGKKKEEEKSDEFASHCPLPPPALPPGHAKERTRGAK